MEGHKNSHYNPLNKQKWKLKSKAIKLNHNHDSDKVTDRKNCGTEPYRREIDSKKPFNKRQFGNRKPPHKIQACDKQPTYKRSFDDEKPSCEGRFDNEKPFKRQSIDRDSQDSQSSDGQPSYKIKSCVKKPPHTSQLDDEKPSHKVQSCVKKLYKTRVKSCVSKPHDPNSSCSNQSELSITSPKLMSEQCENIYNNRRHSISDSKPVSKPETSTRSENKIDEKPSSNNSTKDSNTEIQNQNTTNPKEKFDVKFDNAVDVLLNMTLINSDKMKVYTHKNQKVIKKLKTFKIGKDCVQNIVLKYKERRKTKPEKNISNKSVSSAPKKIHALNKAELKALIQDVLKKIQTDKLMNEGQNKTQDKEAHNIVIKITAKSVNGPPIQPIKATPQNLDFVKHVMTCIKNAQPLRFFITVKNLIKNMRLFIYANADKVAIEVIMDNLLKLLDRIIGDMLLGREKMAAKDVTKLFRESYPENKDEEFVSKLVKYILEGTFEENDFIDKYLVHKEMPDQEEDMNINKETKSITMSDIHDTFDGIEMYADQALINEIEMELLKDIGDENIDEFRRFLKMC